MKSRVEVEDVFRRLFNGGVIRRLPKSQADTDVVLALAAAYLDPRATYSEAAVSECLREWLAGFAAAPGVDHVTLRRYLVDHHFLLRDDAGTRYTANQTVINTVIEPAAREVQPLAVLEAVQRERAERHRPQAAPER